MTKAELTNEQRIQEENYERMATYDAFVSKCGLYVALRLTPAPAPDYFDVISMDDSGIWFGTRHIENEDGSLISVNAPQETDNRVVSYVSQCGDDGCDCNGSCFTLGIVSNNGESKSISFDTPLIVTRLKPDKFIYEWINGENNES